MEQKSAVVALSALAHDARLTIFRLLVAAGPDGIQAGSIARTLDIPKATLSFHLKELQQAGLITSSRKGRSITYAMQPRGIRELLAFLTQDCCQGKENLCVLPSDSC